MTTEKIQWHPAFCAALRIEFANEIEKLYIEPEHQLSKKLMQIDAIVITKEKGTKIQKLFPYN